ncbi:MAG TPA: HAMP domain-containing sensor histidine kinase [Myxococcota bacterium]
MRLILRFAMAFLALVVCLISLHEYRQFLDRREDFAHDMARTHRLVATTLADAVSAIARSEGLESARRTIEEAQDHHASDLRIRWVCHGSEQTNPTPRHSCAEVSSEPHDEVVDEVIGGLDARRLLTWVPVRVAGGGAIEVSETPEHERTWSEQHVRAALTLATTTVAAMTIASFGLGWWLVAVPTRRLRAKARAVGRGELKPDLILPRRDELGEVAEEMNAMCRQLGAAQDTAAREATARVVAVERLQHADRLATIGRLASGLAHELGTPLNVIEARAGLIVEDPIVDDSTRASAQIIIDCAENVAGLVRQLLTFARPRALDLTTVRLDRIAHTVVELLAPLAAQKRVTLAVDGALPTTLSADGVLLQQAVVNLVVNALHACREGGHVTLHVEPVQRTRPASSTTTGNVVESFGHLSVRDDGIGITPEVRAELFEPFFTTRPGGEGTGLGLPIVAGILDDHKGFLEVDSIVGEGSTFHIWVPLATKEAT